MRFALALLALVLAPASARRSLRDRPDGDYVGLLGQFEQRPLVAFLELHGSTEQHTFLRSLVRRPEFGRALRRLSSSSSAARGTRSRSTATSVASASRVRASPSCGRRTTQDSGVWNAPEYELILPRGERRRTSGSLRRSGCGSSSATRRSTGAGSEQGGALNEPGTPCLPGLLDREGAAIHYAGCRAAERSRLAGGRRSSFAGAFHLVRQPAGGGVSERDLA